jgi:hypothetical protein
LVGEKACFYVTLSVRIIIYCGCMWIFIMGAWKESQHGSQQFDKAQHEYKQHMTKVLYMWKTWHIVLVGIIDHGGTFDFSILKIKLRMSSLS